MKRSVVLTVRYEASERESAAYGAGMKSRLDSLSLRSAERSRALGLAARLYCFHCRPYGSEFVEVMASAAAEVVRDGLRLEVALIVAELSCLEAGRDIGPAGILRFAELVDDELKRPVESPA